MDLSANTVNTGGIVNVLADGLTSGYGVNVQSTATALTGDLLRLTNSGNNTGVTGDALDVSLTGAANLGKAINVTQSSTSGANSRAINVTSSQTDATVMHVTADGVNTGRVLDVTADGLTSG